MLNQEEEEDVETLSELGLTFLQAKIYFVLAKNGKSTIKTLAEKAAIDRANTYRVVCKLQEFNLVEKMLTKPGLFRAVPLSAGVAMLLENKEKEYSELAAETEKLIERSKRFDNDKPREVESQFILIPRGKASGKKLTEIFTRTKETNEAIFYWSDLQPLSIFVNTWRLLLKKGAKIRLIIYVQEKETFPLKTIQNLTKNTKFQVKYISKAPAYTLSIYDRREALISISAHASESPNLWVNHAGLVELFHDYFELLWGLTVPAQPENV